MTAKKQAPKEETKQQSTPKKRNEKPDNYEHAAKSNKPIEEKKPRALFGLTPIVTFIAVIFIYFASQIIALYIAAAIGVLQGRSGAELVDWFSESLYAKSLILACIVAVVTGFVVLLLRITRTSWQKIGFTKPKLRHLGEALLGYGWYFLIFLAVTFVVSNFAPQVDLDQQQQLGFDRMATGLALWVIGFSLVILPAFYEELLMRGVLFTGLRSKISFIPTLLIISLLFAAAHLEWLGDNPLNWAAAIDTFALSVILVYLREKSQSLWPAIFLHGIKNLIAFSIVFVFKVAGI